MADKLPDLLPGHADRVEQWPLEDLEPYAGNPWRHPEEQIARLVTSIAQLGFNAPILVHGHDIVAGHARLEAARRLGLAQVPVVPLEHLTDDQARAYRLADNRLGDFAELDEELLMAELDELEALDLSEVAGWEQGELFDLRVDLGILEPPQAAAEAAPPEPSRSGREITRSGDLWQLGEHRVLCGDSTDPAELARLMDGEVAALVHADPPYGIGKEAAGVANDNLYREELDAFQMRWWRAARGHLADNGSAYIWGTADNLWRLWYLGGLGQEPDLHVRNELIWDKGPAMGMRSDGEHGYPTGTERCLFLMLGQQFLGNQNKDDYWEGWEPLRAWLVAERDKAGWTNADVNRITGTRMAGHWMTKSQFAPINERNYNALQEAAEGAAFATEYAELFGQLFPGLKEGGNAHRRDLSAQLREPRSYFDNVHDAMTDVWRFPRVHGEERYGHATPKPVDMIARAVVTSSREGEVVLEPFLGTGSTLMAAEARGRRCFGLELEPRYVDTVVRRWQKATGRAAVLEGDGRAFDEFKAGTKR